MEGTWFAKWTELRDDGSETLWQIQPIEVEHRSWRTPGRIRMVGDAAQGVLCPFEGVVNSVGQIALSYWFQGFSDICGVVFLEKRGPFFAGTWQGYTAKTLHGAHFFIQGRVVMGRDKDAVEKYELEDNGS